MISIIIPTLNEEEHIYDLLKSLCSYPSISEIIVIDGLSKDKTKEEVKLFKKNYFKKNLLINVIDNPKLLQGYALNLGIKKSKNNIIIRIDAHSIISKFKDKDFFYEIGEKLKSNQYSMVGFKQRFMYKTFFEASLFFLSFTFFISKSLYRFANKEMITNDTVWLFAINKEDAESINFLNPEATPNEDYDFCQRLISYKNKPLLIYPKFPIYYRPRSNLFSLSKQYFKYGIARIRTQYRLNRVKSSLIELFLKLLNLLTISIFFIFTLINFKFYLIVLFLIIICTSYQVYMDKLSFSRKSLLSIKSITGILISPYISAIPFFFRTLGKVNFIFRKIFKLT